MSQWEQVAADTIRLEVPGGWLYAAGYVSTYRETVVVFKSGMVFVPDPKEGSELLEALEYVMSAHGEQLTDAFDAAHKAIAKAKGARS
jgi:hypothetical protein